uniref:Uncharacterized protein n=1 Tax=Sarcophilus harrisii TaxID=9305 RepID=A0A7N4NH58_SARHA
MLDYRLCKFSTSMVCRSHYEKDPRKNLTFSVENKCQNHWSLLSSCWQKEVTKTYTFKKSHWQLSWGEI